MEVHEQAQDVPVGLVHHGREKSVEDQRPAEGPVAARDRHVEYDARACLDEQTGLDDGSDNGRDQISPQDPGKTHVPSDDKHDVQRDIDDQSHQSQADDERRCLARPEVGIDDDRDRTDPESRQRDRKIVTPFTKITAEHDDRQPAAENEGGSDDEPRQHHFRQHGCPPHTVVVSSFWIPEMRPGRGRGDAGAADDGQEVDGEIEQSHHPVVGRLEIMRVERQQND